MSNGNADALDLEALRLTPAAAPARGSRAWVYYTCDVDRPMSAETLDAFGVRGWELCGTVKHAGLITYTFKQPATPGRA
jgi:hypothetical protein